jgi:hypothetical protein
MDEIRVNIPQTPHYNNVVDNENYWECCCSCLKFPVHCVKYMIQMTILSTCIGVSLYKIATGGDTNRDIWISLLSSSIGVILPSPSLKK